MPAPVGAAANMIQVKRLVKSYGNTPAVNDISFEVAKGEIVGFLGPNGAGKTTTLRILACFLPATSGSARIAGYDILENSLAVRRRVGYLPEGVPLYPEMRVVEYLNYRAHLKGLRGKKLVQHVEQVMERCSIDEVRRMIIGTLSKGYRQRVGLADALVCDPPVLILDEPTIGLDPNQIQQFRRLIRDLGKDRTILMSTHILAEVETVCQRVIILNSGRIVFQDSLDSIVKRGATGAKFIVEAYAPGEAALSVFREIPGVLNVQWNGKHPVGRFELDVQPEAGIGEEIFRRMARNGWILRELHRQHESLDEIFARCTAKEDALP